MKYACHLPTICSGFLYTTLYTISVYIVLVSYLAVISVRVRRELKEEAERLNVDLKTVVEKALEEEILRKKAELLKSRVDETLNAMRNLTVEDWVKAVRETRQKW